MLDGFAGGGARTLIVNSGPSLRQKALRSHQRPDDVGLTPGARALLDQHLLAERVEIHHQRVALRDKVRHGGTKGVDAVGAVAGVDSRHRLHAQRDLDENPEQAVAGAQQPHLFGMIAFVVAGGAAIRLDQLHAGTNELTCPQCEVPMSELSLVAAQATAPSVTLPISVLM